MSEFKSMTERNVISFPGRDYDEWLAWVECELAILGHDIAARPHDWKQAFDRGLKPEEAAEEAAEAFEAA